MRPFAAAFLLAGTGGAVSAQDVPPPVVVLSFEDALNGAMRDLSEGRLPAARSALDALLKRPLDAERSGIVLASRGVVLVGQREFAAAAADFRDAKAAAPGVPDVYLMEIRAGLGFGRPEFVLGPLTRIAEQHGAWLTLEHRELITGALAMGVQSGLTRDYQDLLLALARADYGAGDLNIRWDLAKEAARIAVERGDSKLAASFIVRIEDRDQIEGILTDRRFSASWPEIEAAVGPHMATLQEAAVQSARKAAAKMGNFSPSLQAVMRAYRLANRHAEADAVGVLIAPSPADIPKLTERDAWAVDEHANVLAEMGRFDEADRRWASLMAIDVERNPWLVGMILNRAANRVNQRNWQAAGQLVDAAGTQYWKFASPYAQQMIRWMQVCVAQGRAQPAVRDAKVAELLEHVADSRVSTIDGLLCAGQADRAAEILTAWLKSGDDIGEAIGRLQPPGSLRVRGPGIWDNADWRKLLSRPEVRAAFDKVARELPETLWPIAISVARQ